MANFTPLSHYQGDFAEAVISGSIYRKFDEENTIWLTDTVKLVWVEPYSEQERIELHYQHVRPWWMPWGMSSGPAYQRLDDGQELFRETKRAIKSVPYRVFHDKIGLVFF